MPISALTSTHLAPLSGHCPPPIATALARVTVAPAVSGSPIASISAVMGEEEEPSPCEVLRSRCRCPVDRDRVSAMDSPAATCPPIDQLKPRPCSLLRDDLRVLGVVSYTWQTWAPAAGRSVGELKRVRGFTTSPEEEPHRLRGPQIQRGSPTRAWEKNPPRCSRQW